MKKKHSIFGIASFLLFLLWCVLFVIEMVEFTRPIEDTRPSIIGTNPVLSQLSSYNTLAIGALLGVASIYEVKKSNKKNVFGIIGLIGHSLFLIAFSCVIGILG